MSLPLQARIIFEMVSVDRVQPTGTTARRRPRSMLPPEPLVTPTPPVSSAVHLAQLESPPVLAATESAVPSLKEEPALLDNLLGWANVNLDVSTLMRFPEVLASRNAYSNIRQTASEVKKLAIALYGFGTGTEARFLCPTCSSSFPALEEMHTRLGRHVIEHFDIAPDVIDICMKVLKIDITYINNRTVTRRDAAAALVIKDEPLPVAPLQEEVSSITIPTVPSDDENDASALPVAEPVHEDLPSPSSRPERRYITLQVSPTVLDQVVTMLPRPMDDGPAFRACIERYLGLRVFERGQRFHCEACQQVGQSLGFVSFSELRRHLIRKHLKLPEHLLVFFLLLVRQQMTGGDFELLPDDLQKRVLALPGAQQTQVGYRLTSYLKLREDADKKFPPMEDIATHVERLCDGNNPAKRKGATLGRLTPSAAPKKARTVAPAQAPENKKQEEEKNIEKSEGGEDVEDADLKFDFEKFNQLANNLKMDESTKSAVKRKMSGLSLAKISCRRIRSDRISFKCACGKYEEMVQSVNVTDGPRRHALRAHVRISKVHWSLCLQCTTLHFTTPDGPINVNQKQPDSPLQSPSTRGDVKTAEEGDSPAVIVCGVKMRSVDKRQPLAHVMEVMNAGKTDYSAFAISGVSWHPLTEVKQQLKTDANAAELRRRLALLPEYRVYTSQGNSRSFVCSTCGFASDYTSRDVKRHILVLHLGINVELVTSILNFAETRSFLIGKHAFNSKDLVSSECWTGCSEPEEAPETAPPETKTTPSEAPSEPVDAARSGRSKSKGRKRLVPRLPAFARKTKKGADADPPSEPVEAPEPEITPEKVVKEVRYQPFVRLVRLSPQEIATGRLEPPLSPTPFMPPAEPPSAPKPTVAASPQSKASPAGTSRKALTVLRVCRGDDVRFRCSICSEERTNKVDLIAHISRVHANLNQSWRYGCKACGARFTGMTMYKAHVDAKHLGAPVLLNRVVNKDWQAEFSVVDIEEKW